MGVLSHLAGSFHKLLADASADLSHLDVLRRADVSSTTLKGLAGTLVAGHLGHLIGRTNTFYQGRSGFGL